MLKLAPVTSFIKSQKIQWLGYIQPYKQPYKQPYIQGEERPR